MAREYGVRYIPMGRFIKYCKDINVKTDECELEHYEKTGVMLPVARVVYPDDFVQYDPQLMRLRNAPEHLGQWSGLERLHEKTLTFPDDYTSLTDEEFIHPFDREMSTNPFLKNPESEDFKPWDCFKIPIQISEYRRSMQSTVDHYYSYWQAHHLYFVQQYPDLYRNKELLGYIREDIRKNILQRLPEKEELSGFSGKAQYFDALSFWITAHNHEEKRTFSRVSEEHGWRNLDESQAESYQERFAILARSVQCRFGLTVCGLYEFLFKLTELYKEYQREERFRLADELREDMIFLAHLIGGITGKTRKEEIADELGRRYPSDSYWGAAKQIFLHLDVATKERDDARVVLRVAAEQYDRELKTIAARNYDKELKCFEITSRPCAIPDGEVDSLLDYCEKEGYSILINALSGMASSEDEHEMKSRKVARYSNLKNVLSSLEYLLKDFATKGSIPLGGSTLVPVIKKMMEDERWISSFNEKLSGGAVGSSLVRAGSSNEFFKNLNCLRHDTDLKKSEDAFVVRSFLITCLARNGTTHHYLTDDWYYGELFGEMLNSAIFAIFYSWLLGKRRKWVDGG